MDTVCEFLQVSLSHGNGGSIHTAFLLFFFQAALTYSQTTLYEECLMFIEKHTEVNV